MNGRFAICLVGWFLGGSVSLCEEPPRLTTLSNSAVKYHTSQKPYVILQRSGVRAVVVDNSSVDDAVLPH